MIFLALFIIPALVAVGFFFLSKHQVTWKEFLIHLGCQCIVAGVSIAIIYYQDVTDVEIWNGRVATKYKDRVSCEHSYSCNCRQECHESCSGSGSSRSCYQSCTTVCDTCYEHSYDYDWVLETTNNEYVRIQRVDRQGVHEPPRFTRASVGDPTSIKHSFDNYLKGASDTLFRKQGLIEKYKNKLPSYPARVYDYHYLNRVVGGIGDKQLWNRDLQELNADLGRKKQANIILIFTKERTENYAYAVEQHWLGGKKNDIAVIVGVDPDSKINWVHVLAWTDKSIFKVSLRDDLLDLGTLDRAKFFVALKNNIVKYYVRKPMADFEYLRSSITPSVTQWIVSMLIGLFVSVVLGFYFWHNEFTSRVPGRRRYFR